MFMFHLAVPDLTVEQLDRRSLSNVDKLALCGVAANYIATFQVKNILLGRLFTC